MTQEERIAANRAPQVWRPTRSDTVVLELKTPEDVTALMNALMSGGYLLSIGHYDIVDDLEAARDILWPPQDTA